MKFKTIFKTILIVIFSVFVFCAFPVYHQRKEASSERSVNFSQIPHNSSDGNRLFSPRIKAKKLYGKTNNEKQTAKDKVLNSENVEKKSETNAEYLQKHRVIFPKNEIEADFLNSYSLTEENLTYSELKEIEILLIDYFEDNPYINYRNDKETHLPSKPLRVPRDTPKNTNNENSKSKGNENNSKNKQEGLQDDDLNPNLLALNGKKNSKKNKEHNQNMIYFTNIIEEETNNNMKKLIDIFYTRLCEVIEYNRKKNKISLNKKKVRILIDIMFDRFVSAIMNDKKIN